MCKFIKEHYGIIIYIIMIFFTDAYISEYRMADWKEEYKYTDKYGNVQYEHTMTSECAFSRLSAATFWPVYWTGKGMRYLVTTVPYVKVKMSDQ